MQSRAWSYIVLSFPQLVQTASSWIHRQNRNHRKLAKNSHLILRRNVIHTRSHEKTTWTALNQWKEEDEENVYFLLCMFYSCECYLCICIYDFITSHSHTTENWLTMCSHHNQFERDGFFGSFWCGPWSQLINRIDLISKCFCSIQKNYFRRFDLVCFSSNSKAIFLYISFNIFEISFFFICRRRRRWCRGSSLTSLLFIVEFFLTIAQNVTHTLMERIYVRFLSMLTS